MSQMIYLVARKTQSKKVHGDDIYAALIDHAEADALCVDLNRLGAPMYFEHEVIQVPARGGLIEMLAAREPAVIPEAAIGLTLPIGTKVLKFDSLHFRLPDSFDGGLKEAIAELLLDFGNPRPRLPEVPELGSNRWWQFLDCVSKGGRFSAVSAIDMWDGKTWHRMPSGYGSDQEKKGAEKNALTLTSCL